MSEINLNKLKLQTPNIYEENIKKLKELFPQIVSEDKIDFDILKQLLSNTIVEADDERYRLDWVGKKRSLLKANTPINKTLRPCKNESVDFENTKNLYIEGDNFEVLKLLQESYLNKIKMIYIDPPYNTGKDSFTYPDDYSKSRSDFEDEIGLRDDEGNKLFKNTDSNGRFHSDWLSMMYERLLVARDLLKDDGVIFISIDDNEVHNLRKICDEVFGEGNFVAEIIINRASEIASNNTVSKHEYLLCYTKNINLLKVNGTSKYTISRGTVGNFEQSTPVIKFPSGLKCVNIEDGVYTETRKIEGSSENIENFQPIIVENGYLKNSIELKAKWRSSNDMRNFFDNNCRPTEAKISGIIEEIYFDGTRFIPQIKKATYEKISSLNLGVKRGSKDLEDLDLNFFPFPKSNDLIQNLIKYFRFDEKDIVLDFFSGSATTAHAVMQLNAQDGGNRKFIMVQIPENTNNKDFPTICEIGKERIKRAGAKILENNKDKDLSSLDIGFRVLKVDSSNMKDVYYHPNEIKQNQLKMFETNIKEDRSDLDLLFSIMLDLGICLDLKITTKIIDDKKLYFIENSELIVCFEENITLKIIETIKEEKPYKVVLKDGCFANDTQKINAILELSLITSISVI